jgi:rhodanese-related sulfurtransferase
MIIDVRTPQEFAAGHLSGAVNLDVNDPSFDARMAQLDRTGTYFVYCRSGNRSAQAVNRMRDAGFVDAYDYGSVEEAASTLNVDIVR